MSSNNNTIGFVDLTKDEDQVSQRHVECPRPEARETIDSFFAKALKVLDKQYEVLVQIENVIMMMSRLQDSSRVTFCPIGTPAGSMTDNDSMGEDSTQPPADDRAAPVNPVPNSVPTHELKSSARFRSRRNKKRQGSAAVPPAKRVKK